MSANEQASAPVTAETTLQDTETDLNDCRQILSADMTREPDTDPLPPTRRPIPAGSVAFALLGAINELRAHRQEIASLRQQLAETQDALNDKCATDALKSHMLDKAEREIATLSQQHREQLIGYEQEADRLTAEALTLRQQLAERDAQIARLTGAAQ